MDTRTLMITASTLGAALFVLMVVVYRTRRVYPGFGCWVVAVGLFAFGTSGFVLLPRSVASSVALNACLVAAFLFLNRGLLRFRGRTPAVLADAAIMAAFLISFVLLGAEVLAGNTRIVVYSLFTAGIASLALWTTLGRRPPNFGSTDVTLAICFGIVVLSGLGRAAYSFGQSTPSPGLLTLGDPVQSYFVLVQLASVVAITITLLNLNAQRIEFDHQQAEQALQRDNLERRRAEEQLRQSELRLHRAQESADVGVWELELATGAVYRSPECARINGLSPDAEAVDAAWRARVHPEDLDRVDRALAPAIREGGRFEAEYRVRLPDGRERWLLTKGEAQCDPQGRPVRLLGVNIDLTERKRAELAIQRLNEDLEARVRERTAELETSNADLIAAKEVAEAASRAKSAFLANMSHELRTPLSAVIGMVGLMRRDSLDARTMDRLGKVETASRHLMDVINDILDLSKIEAERLTLDRVAFSLDSVRERVLNVMGGVAEAKGLALDFRLPPDLAAEPLRGDPLRLAQVLLNLVGNAIKFTPIGQVQVEVRLLMRAPTELSLRFDVRDTGVGIEAQDLRRLFQPFEQVDTSLARRHGGTGLGLAISRRLVEIMGGEVGVRSEPGRGSEFWFTARIARGVDLRRPLTAGALASDGDSPPHADHHPATSGAAR